MLIQIKVPFGRDHPARKYYGDEPGRWRSTHVARTAAAVKQVPAWAAWRSLRPCRDHGRRTGTRRRLAFAARFVSSDRTQPRQPGPGPARHAVRPFRLRLVTSLIGIKRKSIGLVIDENWLPVERGLPSELPHYPVSTPISHSLVRLSCTALTSRAKAITNPLRLGGVWHIPPSAFW